MSARVNGIDWKQTAVQLMVAKANITDYNIAHVCWLFVHNNGALCITGLDQGLVRDAECWFGSMWNLLRVIWTQSSII